jgi:hypothetical protein
MILKELDKIYNLDVITSFKNVSIKSNYHSKLKIFLYFEAFKKYQGGIRFQFQNIILKELDKIYHLDVTASFFDLSIKSNSHSKLNIFLYFEAFKKYQGGIRFQIKKYDSERARQDRQFGHNRIFFGSFNQEQLPFKVEYFFILRSIKKVPRRNQISNSKYDSERARLDLQFRRYRIFF